MKNLKLFWTTCLTVFLAASAGFAEDAVSMAYNEGWGHYNVEGCFSVEADRQTVWDVLTDYGHISQFVGNMKVSEVESRIDDDLILRQEAEGGFLFFTQRIRLLLNVHEVPLRSIRFTDISHKDFYFYQGSWQLEPSSDGRGTEVTYRLDAEQNFSAPAFLASDAVKGGAQDLLNSVRREILQRRQAKAQSRPQTLQVTQAPDDGSSQDSPSPE